MREKGIFKTAERPASELRAFPLAAAKPGDQLEILTLTGSELNGRLLGMGLVPGAVLEVMSTTAPGSVVVALQHQRLGLGPEMAQRIQVVPTGETAGTPRTPVSRATHPTRLQDLAVGSVASVVGYEAAARPYRRKLLAMGLTKGTEFTIVRRAPLGDPVEIRLRGFSLSLRKHEANALLVEPVIEPVAKEAARG